MTPSMALAAALALAILLLCLVSELKRRQRHLGRLLARARGLIDYPLACSRGHGGHAVDAKFCRICGRQLFTPKRRAFR